jgi:alkaline phosphatase D
MGATAAWASPRLLNTPTRWFERRDLFPQGVASGDPGTHSVLLWTRTAANPSVPVVPLTVEVAEDSGFERIIVSARTRALADSDHTCRVLVDGLRPARTYWYRFVDEVGHGSRIGRTRTAPGDDDPRPVKFAFVSCQNVCEGAQNAYRRMIFEDERAALEDQLAFVLHLGDFIYEVVTSPDDQPEGRRYDRRLRNLVHFPEGEQIAGFRIPVTLPDYRSLYRVYLEDPDLQDAPRSIASIRPRCGTRRSSGLTTRDSARNRITSPRSSASPPIGP